MTEAAGPLAEVDPEAVTRAFEADPLTLTDAALDNLVLEIRRRRVAVQAQEAAKALNKRPSKPRTLAPTAAEAAALDKPVSELTSEDLFGPDD